MMDNNKERLFGFGWVVVMLIKRWVRFDGRIR